VRNVFLSLYLTAGCLPSGICQRALQQHPLYLLSATTTAGSGNLGRC